MTTANWCSAAALREAEAARLPALAEAGLLRAAEARHQRAAQAAALLRVAALHPHPAAAEASLGRVAAVPRAARAKRKAKVVARRTRRNDGSRILRVSLCCHEPQSIKKVTRTIPPALALKENELACCRFGGHRDRLIRATQASRSKSIGLRQPRVE